MQRKFTKRYIMVLPWLRYNYWLIDLNGKLKKLVENQKKFLKPFTFDLFNWRIPPDKYLTYH